MTGHIIGHRMNWGLYIKKTLEIHPICRNGVEGANKAEELAVHVSLEASNIIQQARRSYNELNPTSHTANQPFSTRSVPTSSVPGSVPVDHAGKVDLPNDLPVVKARKTVYGLHEVAYDNVLVKVSDAVSGIEILNMHFDYYSKINDVKKAIERARGNPARGISLFHNDEKLENDIVLGQNAEVSSKETFLFMKAHFR